ncbi:hypothetical protein [Streptomyces sp. NPDC046862]|uniref:hypothetical protein n=1 Tax=Streptomyces sp. NPDC046862 TaxID=3154603 RepID=UPI0034565C0D
MSSISRRSLLGYSGTAAAGAVLTSAGAAQAEEDGASTSDSAAVEFPPGTEFRGSVALPDSDTTVEISFTLLSAQHAPEPYRLTELDIANALNELVMSHGWSPITFRGRPAPVAIN